MGEDFENTRATILGAKEYEQTEADACFSDENPGIIGQSIAVEIRTYMEGRRKSVTILNPVSREVGLCWEAPAAGKGIGPGPGNSGCDQEEGRDDAKHVY